MSDHESSKNEMILASQAATIERINACHKEFVELGQRNATGLVEQINKAREIGLLLIDEKAKCRHGEWQIKFQSAKGKSKTDFTFEFDYMTGHNHIKVAKALPEPITSLPEGVRVLTDIYRGMGALPDPEEQEGRRPRLEFLDRATKQVGVAMEVIGKWKAKTPVGQWTDRQREAVREQLQPLVELYNELEVKELETVS